MGKGKFFQGFLGVLGLWWFAALLFQRPIIPQPHLVIGELIHLLSTGRLIHDTGASLLRVLGGLGLSLGFGLPLGLVIGRNPRIGNLLRPMVYLVFPIPKIAFLPVFMVLFGLGDLSKVILLFTVVVFHIIIGVADNVNQIPKEYFYGVRVLGLNRLQIYYHVILPGILPVLLSVLKLAAGTSLSVLFFAENYATRYGLGSFVMNSWIMADYLGMYAGIGVLGFLGVSIFVLIDWIDRRFTHQ